MKYFMIMLQLLIFENSSIQVRFIALYRSVGSSLIKSKQWYLFGFPRLMSYSGLVREIRPFTPNVPDI